MSLGKIKGELYDLNYKVWSGIMVQIKRTFSFNVQVNDGHID